MRTQSPISTFQLHSLIPLLALFMCFGPGRVVGQPSTIDVSTVTAPVNTLSVGDLDFLNSTTPKWLFTINIRMVNGSTANVKMTVSLSFTLPQEPEYENALYLRTHSFAVPGMVSVTNLDLGRTIPLETYSVDQVAKQRLEDIALPTGTIPAGSYRFLVEVREENGTGTGGDTFELELTNPSSVVLLTPLHQDLATSTFPLFQWQYDGPSSRISIYEQLPGQSSLEEAASGVPHLEQVVSMNSFQYPSSGVRTLQPGRTYVWFVEGVSGTAGGTSTLIKSPLRSFTVADPGMDQSLSSLLDELERALPQYRPVFERIREQHMSPSGQIRLNDSSISPAELLHILGKLRRSPEAVVSVEYR